MVSFEGALFGVEMEVVLAKSVEDLSDQDAMASDMFLLHFSFLVPGVDCYVIHIDCDVTPVDEVSKYGVYHSLEGGRGVGQAKEHDCGFE